MGLLLPDRLQPLPDRLLLRMPLLWPLLTRQIQPQVLSGLPGQPLTPTIRVMTFHSEKDNKRKQYELKT